MAVYIGTSGYSYNDWQGIFYPADLQPVGWLEYYAAQFATVEINLTFYRLPASTVFRHWYQRTPADFRFFLKGNRFATHRKRLRQCHDILELQFERAAELNEKLAGFIWQLPPRFHFDRFLFEDFVDELRQMQIVFGQSRQVFEFRDPSWYNDDVYALMQREGCAIAEPDWPHDVHIANGEQQIANREEMRAAALAGRPIIEVPRTADFRYFRRHGPAARYASPYSKDQITGLAALIGDEKHDVYTYFNNDFHGYAIENARQLITSLSR